MRVEIFDRGVFYGKGLTKANAANLRNLKFTTEADLTLSTLPISEFSVEIRWPSAPTDTLAGCGARLYDEEDTLYADYTIVETERNGDFLKIIAQSELVILDRLNMKSLYAANYTYKVSDIIATFNSSRYYADLDSARVGWNNVSITVDPAIADKEIHGYFPAQTARERLLRICSYGNFYVQQYGCEKLILRKLPDINAIPTPLDMGKTFWGVRGDITDAPPILIANNYVMGDGTRPDNATDDFEADIWTSAVWDESAGTWSGNYAVNTTTHTFWGRLEQKVIKNTATETSSALLSSGKNVTTDNYNNGFELSPTVGLPEFVFAPKEWTLDYINNGEIYPGMAVIFWKSESEAQQGFVKSCDFSFGTQAKSKMVIVQTQKTVDKAVTKHTYTFNYVYTNNGKTIQLGSRVYYFPITGVDYDVIVKHDPIAVDVVGDVRYFEAEISEMPLTITESGVITHKITVSCQEVT